MNQGRFLLINDNDDYNDNSVTQSYYRVRLRNKTELAPNLYVFSDAR